MGKSLRATDLDKQFAEHFCEGIDLSLSKIEGPKDILDIVIEYKNFILQQTLRKPSETSWETYEPILWLPMQPGFTLIYGPPDTLKTSIGVAVANWFCENTQLNVCYVDAENKLWKTKDNIMNERMYVIPGRSTTHNIIKKLVTESSFRVLVIDTIIAVSRYEDLLRSLVKYTDLCGLYILLLNQTTNSKYGESCAGKDIISSFSYQKHFLTEVESSEDTYYTYSNNGFYAAFSGRERRYNRDKSIYYKALKEGIIIPEKDGIMYKGKLYEEKHILLFDLVRDYEGGLW